jgi:hypothetical protein
MSRSFVRIRRACLAVGAIALLTGSAWAGFKSRWPVRIDTTTSTATGSLASARSSRNSIEMIGCEVRAWVYNGGQYMASCRAQDDTGASAACWSSNPVIVNALSSLNGDGILQFTWDSAGECVDLAVTNISWADAKVP